jgi:prepilin signal peptidase PulO-like enzyme (type II secretory pathway)
MNLPLCSLIIFVVSAVIAGQINRAIFQLAWHRRDIGPWSSRKAGYSPPKWFTRIPIIGWWLLRGEEAQHGRSFWIRPLLIEFYFAAGMVFLFLFEHAGGLLPAGARQPDSEIIAQFISHLVLMALMVVATFIDIDEKMIPDSITIPGTLAGFVFAAVLPASLLPCWGPGARPIVVEPLWLTSPATWLSRLDEWPGLSVGVACLAGWIFAILPKTLWYRGGARKFFRYLAASIRRAPATKWLCGLFVALALATTAMWWVGGERWRALLTSLVGMGAGGAIVWSVRIVASPILRQEAMGFGDVTLMGMIGAFLGWQTSMLVFFLAPFIGVFIAIAQFVMTRRKDIAYGPFLCAAVVLVLLVWPAAWERWGFWLQVFGWLVPVGIVGCLVLLAIMLIAWQLVKRLFRTKMQFVGSP